LGLLVKSAEVRDNTWIEYMTKNSTVSVEFHGVQRVITGEDAIVIEITGETKVRDVLELVNRRYPALDLDESMIIMTVNQEKVSADRILNADDAVSFIPHISGG